MKPVFVVVIVAVVMIGVMVPSVFAENYIHDNPKFSIDYPSGWIIDSGRFVDNSVRFINNEYWISDIIVSYFEDFGYLTMSDYEFKEIVIQQHEQLCLTSTFKETGFVCSDFKSQNFEIKTSLGTTTTYIHSYSYMKKYLGYSTSEPVESISLILNTNGNQWQIDSEMRTLGLTSFQIQHNADKIIKSMESFSLNPIIPEPTWSTPLKIDSLVLTPPSSQNGWTHSKMSLESKDKDIVDYRIHNYEENTVMPDTVTVGIFEFQSNSIALKYLKQFEDYDEKYEQLPLDFTSKTCSGTADYSKYLYTIVDISCVNENYVIYISAKAYYAEELAKQFLLDTLAKFPLTAQQMKQQIEQQEKEIQEKLSEERRLTKEINDTKTALDNGEIHREIIPPVYYEYLDKWTDPDKLIKFEDIKLLENNDYDLLQINYVYQSDEGNSAGSYPFGNMRATSEFSLDYDSWTSYNFLTTDDATWMGTTLPGSDEWDVECPSYLGKSLNPNIPYTITACYEIPKTVNYFYFENMVFSKSAIISPDNLKSVITQLSPESEEGGGCLIATATYGSELAPQVQQLRELRDNQLLQTESGTAFMSTFNDVYYSFSPIIADYERENPLFKEAVKLAITPMISTLSLMENANSESEVKSLGLSVIMLNIGMYLGVPAVVIVGIKKIK